MNREKFGSRLGFILVSAGCAIGIGNVWKFPYVCGAYGGAAFILIYLVFLLILGMPVLVCEFAIGRASRKSAAACYEQLEPAGTSWHKLKYIGTIGCYLLMMFYTMVAGWMLYYCFKSLKGDFVGATPDYITESFNGMLGDAPTMIFWTILICIIGFAICALGLKGGVERITKVMMLALLAIMVILAIRSVFMEGAGEGIKFYLIPDFQRMIANGGFGSAIFAALSQAFFTLSLGIGAMLIFGSYLDNERSLTGEAISITLLDTFVALTAGFIVIPACFAYGIEPDAGPSLIFITLPNIFAQMPGGAVWGALFFLFLTFAALSTVIAVFENIVAFDMDAFGWTRKKSVWVSAVAVTILSMPAVLGYNVLSFMQPLGEGTTLMDLEDFIVSNNLLPLGSLVYILFCTRKNGWGWDNFIAEANTGTGIKFPKGLKNYMSYGLPLIIIAIYLKGYYDFFKGKGTAMLVGWMIFAVLFLTVIFYFALGKSKKKFT